MTYAFWLTLSRRSRRPILQGITSGGIFHGRQHRHRQSLTRDSLNDARSVLANSTIPDELKAAPGELGKLLNSVIDKLDKWVLASEAAQYKEAIEVIVDRIRANGGRRGAIRAAFEDIEQAVTLRE